MSCDGKVSNGKKEDHWERGLPLAPSFSTILLEKLDDITLTEEVAMTLQSTTQKT